MNRRLFRVLVVASLVPTLLVLSASSAHADPAPIADIDAQPFNGTEIVVERTAGETTGDPDGWRMNQDIWVTNTGTEPLVLEEITIKYAGGSDPSDVTVAAAAFDAIADAEVTTNNEIPGMTRSRIRIPEERVHAFPIADTVTVEIKFVDFDPVIVANDLVEYIGDGPVGSLAFPGALKDLDPGEYWAHGSGHQLRDHHRNQWWERFAEDWGVRRWDTDAQAWTTLTDDATLLGNADWNDDYLIWGKGLYVPVAGEIIACANGHADDSFPNEDVAGVGDYGNFVWIDTGDARVLYAHIQAGTMPTSICPATGMTENPNTPVVAGQYVGAVGNSGNTSNAHLHIDIQRDSDSQGLPLRYHNTRAASSKAFDPDNDPIPWNDVNDAAVSLEETPAGAGMLTEPKARANVTGEISGSPDPVVAGEQLTYDVTIANQGPDAAGATTATITLPPEVAYNSDTAGGDCGHAGGTVTCNFTLDELGPNGEVDSETFEIVVDVPADAVHNNGAPFDVTATGTVTSAVFDDDTSGYSATTTVVAEADLEVVSMSVVDAPDELTVGEPVDVVVRATIDNNGPSAPMDTFVERAAGATANASVTPTPTASVEAALELNENRVIEKTYTVSCTGPGSATFTFETEVSPDRPDDTDPVSSNNEGDTDFTVECIVPVVINIYPGSFENPINLKSRRGIPVAVLTTDVGEYDLPLAFDATTIDGTSVRFGERTLVESGGGSEEHHGRGHVEDALERSDESTLDGDDDMLLHFKPMASGFDGTETEGCVRGTFGPDDWVFQGCDLVSFVP